MRLASLIEPKIDDGREENRRNIKNRKKIKSFDYNSIIAGFN